MMALPSQLAVWPTLEMFQKLRQLAKFLMGDPLQRFASFDGCRLKFETVVLGPALSPRAGSPAARGDCNL
jgi:hypothetical protein